MEFLVELLLQIGIEVLAEFCLRAVGATLQSENARGPLFAALGYSILGACCGGLSLLVFPAAFLPAGGARVVHLMVSPVLAGGLMALVGRRRRRVGKSTIRFETFGYGYVFALAFAVTRTLWVQ